MGASNDLEMEVTRKLLEHDFALGKLTEAIEHVAESSKESNSKLEKIADSMGKQEVILEKISNMDEKYSGSITRIHKRLDEVEDRRKNGGCQALAEERLRIDHLEEKVSSLEDSKTWLVRTVIGKLIVIVLGALWIGTKGG